MLNPKRFWASLDATPVLHHESGQMLLGVGFLHLVGEKMSGFFDRGSRNPKKATPHLMRGACMTR